MVPPMLHTVPRLRLGLGRTDYFLAVKRNANGSWRWEVNCAGRSTSVERSSIHFDTMAAASKAGKEALKRFLDRFYRAHESSHEPVGDARR
jgi:hypothetical protein